MQGVSFTFLTQIIAAQRERLFLWSPLFLGCGIGLYFSQRAEPDITPLFCLWLMISAILVLFYMYREKNAILRYGVVIALAVVLVVTGFLAGALRTQYVHTVMLEKKIFGAQITGVVDSIDALEEKDGVRIVLRDLEIENLPPDKTPRRIRLRVKKIENIPISARIRVKAFLNPPSGAVLPDSFDFRRHLYYMGIGAVGFAVSTPEVLEPPQSTLHQGIEGLRQYIAGRIKQTLPPAQASIALAFMTGQQNALSDADMEAVRAAGLAHILSISGLHITLVAGVLFFMSRLMMAGIPRLALTHPIKKYAAVIAILGAVFYMLLAGSSAPTVRSVLMSGLIFTAIILDRSPISLRLVAFAALMVLLFTPENLISVSFQMSFAAVAGLISFFEVTRPYWEKYYRQNWRGKIFVYVASMAMTTLIATLATMPFSLYHFQQFAFMGVIANFIAVPIISFFIMPLVVLAYFLLPLGIEAFALHPIGFGVDIIRNISYWAASLPNAALLMQAIPFSAFLSVVMAGLWIILWKGWGKTLALIPFLLSIYFYAAHQPPDILISETHDLFAVKSHDALFVNTLSKDKFTRENWEKFYGLPPKAAQKFPPLTLPYVPNNLNCDPDGCRIVIKGVKAALVFNPYELKRECAWADIIISSEPFKHETCRAKHIIDKFSTWRGGATSIKITSKDNIQVKTTSNSSGNRPWGVLKKRKEK